MPSDLRRISLLAIILLVVLRISIGWHLMYEGLWKLHTQSTSKPWTAAPYLKNATGPFRPMFRELAGDPDDLDWLNYDKVSQRWADWRARFIAHYKIDESTDAKKAQKQALDRLLDGQPAYQSPLAALPPGLDLAKVAGVNKEAIRYDAENRQLVVDGKLHLLPTERDRLIARAEAIAAENPDAKAVCSQFISAVNRVYKLASTLGYNEQLVALLKQDPDRVGVVYDVSETEKIPVVVGEAKLYEGMVQEFKQRYAKARTQFEWDHINQQWTALQNKRAEVVGPIQALEQKMKVAAEDLLEESQLPAGPVPAPVSSIDRVNWRTMWGLTIFGLLLMLGLFTRISALGGAALLTLFYVAMPPWPGAQEIPSIEHNLFVNKVFVEMVALLALAALPSGAWFGVDAILDLLFRRKKPTQSQA